MGDLEDIKMKVIRTANSLVVKGSRISYLRRIEGLDYNIMAKVRKEFKNTYKELDRCLFEYRRVNYWEGTDNRK